MKTFYFELERQTGNDNEPDLDLQRPSDRDTEDLGALEVFHFISLCDYVVSLIILSDWLMRMNE